MNVNARIAISIVTAVMLCCAVRGEYRIWTCQDGSVVEAELVKRAGDLILIQPRKGELLRIPYDKLAPEDRRYVDLHIPPLLRINVNPNIDHGKKGKSGAQQSRFITIHCSVTIQKVGPAPYPAPLNAFLFVIGKDDRKGRYVVLDLASSTFSVDSDAANNGHVFSANRLTLQNSDRLSYAGYLVIVCDNSGGIVAVDGNRQPFEEHAEAFRDAGRNTEFDLDFRRVSRGNASKNNPKR